MAFSQAGVALSLSSAAHPHILPMTTLSPKEVTAPQVPSKSDSRLRTAAPAYVTDLLPTSQFSLSTSLPTKPAPRPGTINLTNIS